MHHHHALAPSPPPAIERTLSIGEHFTCRALPVQHDGDNLSCAGIASKLRMHSIDAPEVEGSPACNGDRAAHHDCDFKAGAKARDRWQQLIGSRSLRCIVTGDARYGRMAVACTLPNGSDPECTMVRWHLATARYEPLPACPAAAGQFRSWR